MTTEELAELRKVAFEEHLATARKLTLAAIVEANRNLHQSIELHPIHMGIQFLNAENTHKVEMALAAELAKDGFCAKSKIGYVFSVRW